MGSPSMHLENVFVSQDQRKKYLQRRQLSLKYLNLALVEGNFEAFKTAGHQLRGNASSYGFQSLTSIGAKMEHAGMVEETTLALQSLKELEFWVSETMSDFLVQ